MCTIVPPTRHLPYISCLGAVGARVANLVPKLPPVAFIPFEVIPPITEDKSVVPKVTKAIAGAKPDKAVKNCPPVATTTNITNAAVNAALKALAIYPPSFYNFYILLHY